MATVRDHTALTFGGHWLANSGGPSAYGQPALLTFSFPTSAPPSMVARPGAAAAASFQPFNEIEKVQARLALQQFADASGLTFVEVSGNAGDIRFGYIQENTVNHGNFGGIGFGPYNAFYSFNNVTYPNRDSYLLTLGTDLTAGGDTFYNLNYRQQWQNDNNMVHTLLHEIGHAIGLKHPHEGENQLDKLIDNTSTTVMSYVNNQKRVTSLGPLDIEAIQVLYSTNDKDGIQYANWSFNGTTETFTLIAKDSGGPLRGTGARDIIQGGPGADVVTAGDGNDVISPGKGLDNVSGGPGLDWLILNVARSSARLEFRPNDFWTVSSAEGNKLIFDIERLQFLDQIVAFDAGAAQTYRLYQAAFARTPDQGGLSFWVDKVDDGAALRDVASGFIGSPEFESSYGMTASPERYVEKFYQNVLGRSGEASGVVFWTNELKRGVPLAEVLLGFAESSENVARLAPMIGQGVALDPSYFV
jgi:hypothetical protein